MKFWLALAVLVIGYVIYIEVDKYTNATVMFRHGNVYDYPSCNENRCRVRVKWRLSGDETVERFRTHQLPVIGERVVEECYVFDDGERSCTASIKGL